MNGMGQIDTDLGKEPMNVLFLGEFDIFIRLNRLMRI